MRLNSFLQKRGLASRRQADRLIVAGCVRVNSKPGVLGQRVCENDIVELITSDGQSQASKTGLCQQAHAQSARSPADIQCVTYALYKPAGYMTSSRRSAASPQIVLDCLPVDSPRVFPVGRLDKETTGLLILTNDGMLANALIGPASTTEKEYEAHLAAQLTPARACKVRRGVRLERQPTRPVRLRVLTSDARRVRVVLTEGKNRQIRKIFGKVGCEVTRLHRLRIGGYRLPAGRSPGDCWRLNAAELRALQQLPDKESGNDTNAGR